MQCRYAYDAWGNHKIYDGSGVEVLPADSNIGNVNPFRYRGYYWDGEFGWYYLKTRYYDPAVGRFISPDAVEYLDPESVQGLNLYAYCANNPIMHIDPDGSVFGSALFLVLAVMFTISDINTINQSSDESFHVTTASDKIEIQQSYRIITPWVQYGYAVYLNYFNDSTKDIIKGTSVGMQFEWAVHNLAFYGLSAAKTILDFIGVGSKSLDDDIEQSASVNMEPTIFHDKHDGLSIAMFCLYYLVSPRTAILDFISFIFS
ncbi:MAG: RHS repeat-associated core domain-containing protein [Clostridia bacterium]|nr:RHS repeat-associated core domain-containing protein [Clostridia bacterium]